MATSVLTKIFNILGGKHTVTVTITVDDRQIVSAELGIIK